jgi:hypothetical protein
VKKATRRTPAAKPAAPAAQLTHEMIARRAYEIWLTNIRRAYQPAQDWVEAEKQLRAELKKKPARAKREAPQPKPQAAPAPTPAPANPETRLAA